MIPNEKTLTIVYQFGKVASTSLVNTLGDNPMLDVHQSHFLGESALQRIIPIAVDKSTSAYFHEHLRGQLMANVELTYRMNCVLGGRDETRLKVISLSREPLDWLRSGVLQDIAGYRSEILAFAARQGLTDQNEDTSLQSGLIQALARIVDLIDGTGGIVRTVQQFHDIGGRKMLQPYGSEIDPIVRKLFFLALRPTTWFDEHFQPCFGLGLSDFEKAGEIWTAHLPRADFVILRYEDLSKCLAQTYDALGLKDVGPLKRDNISRTKPYADVVSAAFASSHADTLRARLLGSDYARFFGYAEPLAQSGTAAE